MRFIAEGDHSDYVRTTLLDLEAHAKAEKRAIADLVSRNAEAVRLPSPEETVERAFMFEKMLLEDPVAGREELRRMFQGEQVLLRPQPTSTSPRACSSRSPSSLCASERRRPPLRRVNGSSCESPESRGLPPSCSSLGCAGPIRGLEHVVFRPFSLRLVA